MHKHNYNKIQEYKNKVLKMWNLNLALKGRRPGNSQVILENLIVYTLPLEFWFVISVIELPPIV